MIILPPTIKDIYLFYWCAGEESRPPYETEEEDVENFLTWLSGDRDMWNLKQGSISFLDACDKRKIQTPKALIDCQNYLDKFAYAICAQKRGIDLSKGTLKESIENSAEEYVKKRASELYDELWVTTYSEFNKITFPELNNLVPNKSKIDCIDFRSDCFCNTERMQIWKRGYAHFASLSDEDSFENTAISLIMGRTVGLGGIYSGWILDLDSANKPKTSIKNFTWNEQCVYDRLFICEDWIRILRKIESYESCDIMGSEKVAKRRDNEPDNLTTRIDRWERVNFQRVKDLSLEEWVRVINNIGCMTEREAEELYYTLRLSL